MINKFTAIEKTYIIAHNNANLVNYQILQPNQTISTGLANLETFTDEVLWMNRLEELGLDLTIDNKEYV